MRMQVFLDSFFTRPGSGPIWGGKKGEFRDWITKASKVTVQYNPTGGAKVQAIGHRLQVTGHRSQVSNHRLK